MIATMAPIELSELQEKASLQTRIDRKYVVELDQLDNILGALPTTTQVLQIDARRQFCYRSVYFDTADLLAYRLTALRRHRRFKIRTRSYLDSGRHLLEVKTRGSRGTTVKQQLAYDGDGEHLLGDDRQEACRAVAQTGAMAPRATELRPVLITTYRRVTLFLPTSRSRVTIDTDLCWLLPDGSRVQRLGSHAIVETKCVGSAAEMDRALWAHQHRPCSISKFGTGLAALRPELPANRWRPVLHRHLRAEEIAP